MSSPNSRNTPQANPLEDVRVAAEIMERNLKAHLDPEDFAAMGRANGQLMTHATVGLVFGAGAGVLFALRRRGARALDGAAKSFYPTRSGAAVVPKVSGAEAPPVDEIANRARTFAKAVGLGFIGGVAGLQLGAISGTRAGKRTIAERPGADERFNAAMLKVAEELQRKLPNASVTKMASKKAAAGTGPLGGEFTNFAGSETFEATTDDFSRDEGGSGRGEESQEQDQPPSRWEELRKSRAAPPSSWDQIREANARSALPPKNAGEAEDVRFVSVDKEAERKEFEEMMERERKGGSDGGFEGNWKEK